MLGFGWVERVLTFEGKKINDNFKYQYLEPVANDGGKIQVPRGNNPTIFLQLLKHNSPLSVKYGEVFVSLILEGCIELVRRLRLRTEA